MPFHEVCQARQVHRARKAHQAHQARMHVKHTTTQARHIADSTVSQYLNPIRDGHFRG